MEEKMKSLGILLRNAIEKSGYTIYRAANISGINRTTLQKVLSDDRSASQELLDQLLPILKLSPSEEKDIHDLFEMSQYGETLYHQRRYIKEILESMSHLDLLPQKTGGAFQRLMLYESSLIPFDQQLIHGIYNVEHFLGALLNRECQHSSAKICMNIPGNLPVLNHLFIHNISYYNKRKCLTIQHIISLVKTPENCSNSLINLDILSNILPFTIFWDLNYKIYYYYCNELISDTLNTAFPYYILFSDVVVLLNSDGTTALPVCDPTVLRYFQNLFAESLKQSTGLITDCANPEEILNYLISADKEPFSHNTIEFQPCLTTFLTENMIRKYARPDIENREHLIQAVIYRAMQLAHLEKRICIFSQTGLASFIQNGILSDFPTGYILPLEKPDQIELLESLYDACLANKVTFRMANPIDFSFSEHLTCTLRNNWGIDFNGFDSSGGFFRYIHITEHTILEAFEDFFQYILDSKLIYTKEETLSEIRTGINYLKSNS